jgi:hypothetical protein
VWSVGPQERIYASRAAKVGFITIRKSFKYQLVRNEFLEPASSSNPRANGSSRLR